MKGICAGLKGTVVVMIVYFKELLSLTVLSVVYAFNR